MTASLVGVADLHRYTQVEWDKATSASKAEVKKAQKEKDMAEKEKETLESCYAILESEKTSLVKVVEEAKAAKEEAVATAASLRSEWPKKQKKRSRWPILKGIMLSRLLKKIRLLLR